MTNWLGFTAVLIIPLVVDYYTIKTLIPFYLLGLTWVLGLFFTPIKKL